jgi:alanine dehydrogenase
MYIIGIPKEIKSNEGRVSLIPKDVEKLINKGHEVYFQKGAGYQASYLDIDYISKGAKMCDTIEEIYEIATLIVKVKEPQPSEFPLITNKHTLFTFFHFAGNAELLDKMIETGATCYAYETISIRKDDGCGSGSSGSSGSSGNGSSGNGSSGGSGSGSGNGDYYPILAPMSKIAGEQAFSEANKFISGNKDLHKMNIPISIVGVGNVGTAAMNTAIALGYKNILLIDKDYEKICKIQKENSNVVTAYELNDINLELIARKSIIIVGSVYNRGEKATNIFTNELLDLMPQGSILMDVAIDQGGVSEQSRPTTFDSPIIKYNNTNIYCVPNIPSCVPKKASKYLSNSIIDYVNIIAKGEASLYHELSEGKGLNVSNHKFHL